jgi:molecular chaperone HtpG
MSSNLPILTSIKSEWNHINETPILGKDVLELLSSSMYVNPLSIYREYIQNSVDSIEEATALGLLGSTAEGRVDILIDSQERRVRIRDNGTGIPSSQFVRRLTALGASRKRGMKARGFRGVGRLAGLGYCQELIFRSRADGEREASELRWDCKKLKAILRDAQFSDQLGELIAQIVRTRRAVADQSYPERFFEVELVGMVRHGADALMNPSMVGDYLSQVAPVPFSPEFSYRELIENALIKHVNLGNVAIHINGSAAPLYRPYRDSFSARKGVIDKFTDIQEIKIEGASNGLAAIGWVLHHGYIGSISLGSPVAGLRVRCGNIQVGENNLLNELFQEPRFNGWAVGEVHVLDDRILPNGRRDHFEQSVPFKDLLNQLSPLAAELTRRCRVSSIQRNAVREFESKKTTVEHMIEIVEQGALSREKRKTLIHDIEKALGQIRRLSTTRIKDHRITSSLSRKAERLRVRAEKVISTVSSASRFSGKTRREKQIYENVFGLIYDCLSDQKAAKTLIDLLLERLN